MNFGFLNLHFAVLHSAKNRAVFGDKNAFVFVKFGLMAFC